MGHDTDRSIRGRHGAGSHLRRTAVLVAGLLLLAQGCGLRSVSLLPLPAATAMPVPTETAVPTSTLLPTATMTPTRTSTATPSPTVTPLPSVTESPSVTASPSAAPGSTATRTPPAPILRYGTSDARLLAPNAGPTVLPEERYRIGGIHFGDATAPLSIAYPASFDPPAVTRYNNLQILPFDYSGKNYQRFITDYGGKVYAYIDTASGTFVLSVHDGTLTGSGRELEAEPLRRLIEGNLHAPYSVDIIRTRLDRLMGREWVFTQGDAVARFRLIQAERMSAADVAYYQDKASMLSTFLDGIPEPSRMFMFFFCSGRQPGEPAKTFAGRYVLLLELLD